MSPAATSEHGSGEIRFVRLTRANFKTLYPSTRRLLRRQRDGRLTRKSLRRYWAISAAVVEQPGNLVLAALNRQGRCVGVAAALRWGYRLSLVAVSKRARGRGIGGRLLHLAVQALGRYYAEVAGDNLPSLRAFFSAGLRAYDAFTRPNGKVVLRLRTVDPPPTPTGTPAGTPLATSPGTPSPPPLSSAALAPTPPPAAPQSAPAAPAGSAPNKIHPTTVLDVLGPAQGSRTPTA